jgi:hypothetical protein
MEGTTEETVGKPSPGRGAAQEHVSVPSDGEIPCVAAIVNSKREDGYEFPDVTDYMVLTNGRSHFGAIIQDDSKA